jgi:nucleotide-binding universal stress UspA family protein
LEHIVVGTDGSEGADGAVRWALDEARRWGASLEVVLAWSYLDQPTKDFRASYDEADARATLDEAITRAGDSTGVQITATCVNDLATRALLEAAERADLVVVGSRGLGGIKGMFVGSVSQHVVTRAPANVVVVRPTADAQ